MKVLALDHWVLTVQNIERSLEFYGGVLGMEIRSFGENRIALHVGNQKINLYEVGSEITPHASRAFPGSADMCFLISGELEDIKHDLERKSVELLCGIVERVGAQEPIRSLYLRDPDGNLIELSQSM